MDNNNTQNNVKVFGNASINTDKKVDSNGGGANTSKNEKTIFFVEPLKNLPVDNKELVIYVDLVATRKARTVLQVGDESNKFKSVNGTSRSINLIGYRQYTQKNYKPDGTQESVNFKSMSTDWSRKANFGKSNPIGTQTDLSANGEIFEGFGVENIDINITAMNPPTVTIKFIDTRGGGLFDQEVFNQNTAPQNAFQNNSPYSIFFEMPPPLFYLTVKGYYGNPVTLCLYMIKWDGTFNSETGNFEMTAQFLGYTFAFLQDIRVGHLIGASNSNEGKSTLVKVSSQKTEEGYVFPPITLDDLLIKFQRITIKREEEQKNSKDFDKLRLINEQNKYITQFRAYLGYPASPNLLNNKFGSYVDTSFIKPTTEQIFFRDVGIFKKNPDVEKSYDNLAKSVDDLLKKYEELKKQYTDFYQDGDLTRAEIYFPNKITDLDSRSNITDTLVEVNRLIKENEKDFNSTITLADFTGTTKNKWPLDGGFYIINLRKTRDNINKKLNNLINIKNLQEKAIQEKFDKEVTDILGFEPNVRTIIGILCNNIEMFLEMIHKCGEKAERQNGTADNNGSVITNSSNPRRNNLSAFDTDAAKGEDNIVYPFPKVFDKDFKEIYLGDINGISKEFFPEIEFIDSLCNGLVYSIKQVTNFNQSAQNLEQVSSLEPFPINVRDLTINPYTLLDGLPSEEEGTINKEVVYTIIRRAFIAYAMSKYKESALSKIAELEAINFYETLVSDTYKQLFSQLTGEEILNLALSDNYGILTDSSTNTSNYKLQFSLYPESFDLETIGTTNSGVRQWDYTLNLRDKIKDSLKISEKDSPEIKKFTSPKRSETYVERFFDVSNSFLNKSYFTLKTFKLDSVKNSIKEEKDIKNANLFEVYSFDDLRIIDNKNGMIPNESQSNYFLVPRTVQNINPIPVTLSSIYTDTTNNFGKAYLILSSFLFETDKVLDEEIGDDYTKIIRLPWFYLLWLGANAYRKNNGEILSFNSEFISVPTTKYYYVTTNENEGITNSNLIDLFQDSFEIWVNSVEFIDLKNYLERILNTPDLGENERIQLTNELNNLILKEYDLLIYDSTWMRLGDSFKDETIPKDELSKYLNNFVTKYNNLYAVKPGTNSVKKEEKTEEQVNNVVTDKDLKLPFYIDVKQIYDNWIAGNSESSTYSCCNTTPKREDGQKLKLFDMFKFVDKFRNATAGDAIININSFSNLVNDRANGLYSFISKVLTDSYFMHFNLPFYLEFQKPSEVASIFEPQLTFEKIKNRPSFLCVYNGPPSNTLNSTTNYGDDSFLFKEPLPKPILQKKNNEKNSYLVAFNVNYGSQTQSIFKNVNVSTQESKMTGEYITLLSDYVQGTGSAKPLLKDNSIYPLMRNRSYTATIQMLGDMMIQPQMYFQLNNIPFFSGAYMVMNVSHQIKPNHMVTTFKGVRQNRSPVTIVTKPTTFLNFQYNQGITSGLTVNITRTIDQVKEKQAENSTAVIDTNVIKNYAPTTGIKILKYISTGEEYHSGLDIQVDTFATQIQSVNKKGIILENFKGTETTPGRLIIKHDPESDGYTYFTGYFNIVNNDFSVGGGIVQMKDIGNPISFSSTTIKQRTIQPTQPNSSIPISTTTQDDSQYYEEIIVKYYYHFEVKRTKENITTYEEYKNSTSMEMQDPQKFTSLEPSIEDKSLHDDSIY